MDELRFLAFQFCDDVRQEVGNKFSLIGCYGESMLVSSLPAVLPKLCVQVRAYTSTKRPFKRLVLRLVADNGPLLELPVQDSALQLGAVALPAEARWHYINAFLILSPFPIEKPCALRLEADTEEGILHGGRFLIDIAPTTN